MKSQAIDRRLATITFVCLMVFNATFNNISVISWRSVLLVGETGVPGEVTLTVIGADCTGNCKSNYHTIMATMAPP